MPSCIVDWCKSGGRQRDPDVILHVFPKDKEKIKLWIQQTGQHQKDLDAFVDKVHSGKKYDIYRLCSLHFTTDSYEFDPERKRKQLRKNAVPTMFCPPAPDTADGDTVAQKRRRRRFADNLIDVSLNSKCVCPNCGCEFEKLASTKSVAVNTVPFINSVDKMTEPSKEILLKYRRNKRIQCTRLRPRKRNHKEAKNSTFGKQQVLSDDSLSLCSDIVNNTGIENIPIGNPLENCDFSLQGDLENSQLVEVTLSPTSTTSPVNSVEPSLSDMSDSSSLDDSDSTFRPSESEDSTSEEETLIEDKKCTEGELLTNRNFENSVPVYPSPVRENKFLIFESCLDQLILKIQCTYTDCKSKITHIRKHRIGSSIVVHVKCSSGHPYKLWESQPRRGSKTFGNILIAAGILTSGNTYGKIKQFFYLANILGISESSFYRYQKQYLFPTIDRRWKTEQSRNLEAIGGRPVCVVGDSQCDAPAKYCVYTLMDANAKKILSFDVQELVHGASSDELEKIGCDKSLDFLLESNVNVKMIITDRHPSIRKMLCEKYPSLEHDYDIRHLAKTIGNKMTEASHNKHCEILSEWITPVKNHLWFSSATCGESYEVLLSTWLSLLKHVVNVHEWTDENNVIHHCEHDSINANAQSKRKWIHPDSVAFSNLEKIVNDIGFKNDLKHLAHFCHTGILEVYHNALLKYHTERQDFSIDDMVARTQLAALDHNVNCDRVQATMHTSNSEDSTSSVERYSLEYSKAIRAIYESSNQSFLFDIIEDTFNVAIGNKQLDLTSIGDFFDPNIAPVERTRKKK